jgi:hypothetical protein
MAIPLTPDKEITQSFTPPPKLFAMQAQFVTWGRPATPYTIGWRVVAFTQSHEVKLGSGEIDTTEVHDWQAVELPIASLPEPTPQEITVSFKAHSEVPITVPVGVPLFAPKTDAASLPARIGNDPAPAGAQVGLTFLNTD